MSIGGVSEQRLDIIDRQMNRVFSAYLKNVLSKLDSTTESAYASTSLANTAITMLWHNLQELMPAQEAKAAMKVIIDGCLLEHGMHLSIQEFGMN